LAFKYQCPPKIIHSATISRTRIELKNIHSQLKYYVQNSSYPDATKILDAHHYCIISGIPGIGKTTLANTLFIKFTEEGFEPVRIYQSIEEGFEMLKESGKQVFYFDDFLGTTAFDENSLGRNEDKQLLAFLQCIRDSDGEKKFLLTTRDYILQQARLSFESMRMAELNPHLCTIDLHDYGIFDRAEILYNHLYFSNLSESQISEILKDRRYFYIIKHPNYSPRVIEMMTQVKTHWPEKGEDFAAKFLGALDNPQELWKHAFEKTISLASQHLLWSLVTLPDTTDTRDLERVFWSFHRYMAKSFQQPISSTEFRDSLEEIEGTFIKIDSWGEKFTVVQFHNPSIRDFLEKYLTNHHHIIINLISSAQFFSQFRWLWGRKNIGFDLSGKPYQIQPEYRPYLLQEPNNIVECIVRTLQSDSPFLNAKGRRAKRLAGRLLLVSEIETAVTDERLNQIIKDTIPELYQSALQNNEISFELTRLADRFRNNSFFSDIKKAFLLSLNSMADFERYLTFSHRYASSLTKPDKIFVKKRFSELHNGLDISYLAQESYWDNKEHDNAYDDYDLDLEEEQKRQKLRDERIERENAKRDQLINRITNLFDSLKN